LPGMGLQLSAFVRKPICSLLALVAVCSYYAYYRYMFWHFRHLPSTENPATNPAQNCNAKGVDKPSDLG
jgi:hypothetical protein